MVRLRGGHLVLADRVVRDGALAIDGGRIVEVGADIGASLVDIDCAGGWVLPGFIDTHIHGVHGTDVLEGGDAVARVAASLPRYGVTGFCPTSVACAPDVLARFLGAVGAAASTPADSSRVLGAHLESNFINPDYRGAQPHACLRLPPRPGDRRLHDGEFTGAAILATIDGHTDAVRIVTLAPELPGALGLIAHLVARGHRVALGHSAATYEEGRAGIAAGATHATHLFNRMPPMTHRAPGLAGALLASDAVMCEIVGDGWHVHPALMAVAIRAKGRGGVAAITDAVAVTGLPPGATGRLGDHAIRVGARWAELADGTIAGSITTMDAVFRRLVTELGLSVVDAAHLTSTTPATAVGRPDLGRLVVGHPADLVVLDRHFRPWQTWVAGRCAWTDRPGVHVAES